MKYKNNTQNILSIIYKGFQMVLVALFFLFACDKGKIIFDEVAPKLSFEKLSKEFSAGGSFTTDEILEKIKEDQGTKANYTLKSITNITPNDVVTVAGTAPNLSFDFNKIGNFTATITLQHPTKESVTISKARFEITRGTAPTLTFNKVTKQFVSGGKFTITEIIAGVTGIKTGYTLKNITAINPSNLVTVSPTKELIFRGGLGNFTATIILQHPTKNDTTLTNCEFEITNTPPSTPNFKITWEKTFGGAKANFGNKIIQTGDGGYLIVGQTYNNNGGSTVAGDIYLLKLNDKGVKEWDKNLGDKGGNDEEAKDIVQTPDGGYLLLADKRLYSSGIRISSSIWVVKLSSTGVIQYQKIINKGGQMEGGRSIIQTRYGGYVILGYRTYFPPAVPTQIKNTLVIKLNSLGVGKIWEREYGLLADDNTPEKIIQTKDLGYAFSGKINNSTLKKDKMWLVKITKDGTKEWEKIWGKGKSRYDGALGLIQDTDEGYVMVGHNVGIGIHINYSANVVKIDRTGNEVWSKEIKGAHGMSKFNRILKAKNTGYIVLGSAKGRWASEEVLWLLKLNTAGNILLQKKFGTSNKDVAKTARDIIQTRDGGYAILAQKYRYTPFVNDIWVIKIN